MIIGTTKRLCQKCGNYSSFTSAGERNYPRLVEQRFCMISYANILVYRLKLMVTQ